MNYKQLLVLLSTPFILSACGPSGTIQDGQEPAKTVSQGKSYDPCDLLTVADLTEVFPGSTPVLSRHDTEANPVGMKICYYDISEKSMNYAQLAVINVADAPANIVKGNSLKPLMDSEKSFLQAGDIQTVEGLGDEAYYGGSGLKPGAGLHVLDNQHGVKIDISVGLGFGSSDQAEHLKIEKALAEKALSHL